MSRECGRTGGWARAQQEKGRALVRSHLGSGRARPRVRRGVGLTKTEALFFIREPFNLSAEFVDIVVNTNVRSGCVGSDYVKMDPKRASSI